MFFRAFAVALLIGLIVQTIISCWHQIDINGNLKWFSVEFTCALFFSRVLSWKTYHCYWSIKRNWSSTGNSGFTTRSKVNKVMYRALPGY